ncbi:hypothetical protein PTSG_12207 [Salpingoeca rosetta]|uniref:Bardet-Biedl syndrome 2 protein homolog n=1 Tax=Salpingoeca rosetta (strain ATCC 50818 / BSB-021) TaxID=946362 RepID=F2U9J6_SALR5|nr:uncharacterized protein PTSG_12207 [Salpingoeca rosetta]EGD73023.1 hypothetical protein PTSG_12207 [Salpingoeca rosetta]|eukprot:XP_004994054.1 hypothetical protein PTSG_12207 [Salpingoeca rosetta]
MSAPSQLSTAFTLKLGFDVQPGCVAVGRLDGVHPCLVCAAPGGKVVVHSPHHAKGDVQHSKKRSDISVLRFNREVTRLCCGSLEASGASQQPDLVFVGSSDNLTAYDVVNNCDKFSVEAADGCSALCIGKLKDSDPLVFIGGTCSIYGYDADGNDQFWTVTGDDVTAMAVGPFTTGDAELVVGSEDFDIRSFNADAELLVEISERDAITQLIRLSGQRFAFSLANGTVGVFQSSTLLWSHKTKHQATALAAYDINFDGVPELAVGWADGRVDVFNPKTGDIITSQSMKAAIAGLAVADYRMEGKETLIAVSIDGRVCGFSIGMQRDQRHTAAPVVQEDLSARLRLLQQKKKDLQYRLSALSQQTAGTKRKQQQPSEQDHMIMATHITTELKAEDGKVILTIATSSGAPIRSVVLFADGLFEGESYVMHCAESAKSDITISLVPPRLEAFVIDAKVLVGPPTATKLGVCEVRVHVPKFASFHRADVPEPTGAVTFPLQAAQTDKVVAWVNKHFLLPSPVTGLVPPIGFASPSGSIYLVQHGNNLVIGADRGELASILLQSLTSEVKLKAAESAKSTFPSQLEELQDTLRSVSDLHAARQKLSVEIADQSNLAKSLLLRAEDYRMMGNFAMMRGTYLQLGDVNRDLIKAYNIRNSNYDELVRQLKALNQFISRTADLYVGKARTDLIASCRAAIKANDMDQLFNLLKSGATASPSSPSATDV